MRLVRTGALILLLGLALGCKRTAPAPESLRVTEVKGSVEAERDGKSTALTAGAALAFGTHLRTGAASSAKITFPHGQSLAIGEHALVKLGQDAGSSLLLTVSLGEAVFEGAGQIEIANRRSPVRLLEGGRLRVRAEGETTRLELLLGKASLDATSTAAAMALAPGDGLAISIGGATIERYQVEIGAAQLGLTGKRWAPTTRDSGAPASPATPVTAPQRDAGHSPDGDLGDPRAGAVTASGADPSGLSASEMIAIRNEPADILLAPGETATVHSERSPTLVRLRLPADCNPASASLRGLPRAVLLDSPPSFATRLTPGTYRYRIVCAGRDASRGTLVLRDDPAVAPLPRKPPQNQLDADGRRYTVLYQNLLPVFSLSWSRVPAGEVGPFALHVQPEDGRERRLNADRPTITLPNGTLAEGQHTWWWTSARGTRSPTTTVTVRFDNAATAAEIQLPRPLASAGRASAAQASKGPAQDAVASIRVAGTTLPGSLVTVGEQAVPLDVHARFRAYVPPPPPDARALTIRIQHRRSGVHYYLRRLSGR